MFSIFAHHSRKLGSSPIFARLQSTLVFIEHDGTSVLPVSRHAITAAKKLGGEVAAIVVGPHVAGPVKETAQISGISKLLVAESADFTGFLPERLAPVFLAAQDQFKFSHIVAGASAVSRSFLPRVAAKLDVSPISDIIGIKDSDTFVRTFMPETRS